MNSSTRLRTIVAIVLAAVTLALLYKFRSVFPIFVLALFLAYILTPLVVWMSSKKVFRHQIPRGVSIIIIYLVMITSVSFGGAYFVINLSNEVRELVKDIPAVGEKVTKIWVPAISQRIENISLYMPHIEKVDVTDSGESEPRVDSTTHKARSQTTSKSEIVEFLRTTRFEVKQDKSGFEIIPKKMMYQKESNDNKEFDLQKIINNFISGLIENLQSILLGFLDFGQIIVFSIVTSIFQTMITLMVAAFIIIDHERILDYIRGLFPSRFFNRVELFLEKQNAGLAGVVRGQLIVCVVNGTLTGIGLLIFDVKFTLTLSLLATVCSLIPIFGVFISSIPIILMAITNSFLTGVIMLGWILMIHFIEGNILNPKIIGRSAEIHPVLVILALIAGEKASGLFGALIAVPIFSMLQTTFLFVREIVFEEPKEVEPKHVPFPESTIYDD